MKHLAIILSLAFLGGCAHVPLSPKFPDVPESFLKECEDLEKADVNDTRISAYTEVVVNNYTKSKECAADKKAWISWYKEQKAIFNDAVKPASGDK